MSSDLETARRTLHGLIDRAILRGTFTLASGKTSNFYINGKLFTLCSDGAFCAARLMLEILRRYEITVIVGAPRGGDPIVGALLAVAHENRYPVKALMVRKEPKDHGTGKLVEGPALQPGDKVAIIEDTTTTGGSALRIIQNVEKETGAKVALGLAVMDREEGAAQNFAKSGVAFESLFKKSDFAI